MIGAAFQRGRVRPTLRLWCGLLPVVFFTGIAVLTIATFAAPQEATKEEVTSRPAASNGVIPFDEAKQRMVPLSIGDLVASHEKSDFEAFKIEKYRGTLNGIPVDNVVVRVRVRDDGTREALDDFQVESGAVDSKAIASLKTISRDDAVTIATADSDYVPGEVQQFYIAEEDLKQSTLTTHVINRLVLVWRIALHSRNESADAPSEASRIVLVDAETGAIRASFNPWVSEAPPRVSVQADGFHFPHSVIDNAMVSATDETHICLRDPVYQTTPFTGCSLIASLDASTGIATYVPQLGLNGFVPAFTQTGTIGNMNKFAPQSVAETDAVMTQAADVHIGLSRAIGFFRLFFGRNGIGSLAGGNTLRVLAFDPTVTDNAFANKSSSQLRFGRSSAARAFYHAPSDPQVVAHEYAHLVFGAETMQIPDTTPSEYTALGEGIADIFGILVTPTMNGSGSHSLTIRAPAEPWHYGSGPSETFRYFSNPLLDGKSVEYYGQTSLQNVAFSSLDPHDQSGVLRRWFYMLAMGASRQGTLIDHPPSSFYLENGMQGIGVESAARILYQTITRGALNQLSTLDYRTFRSAMIQTVREAEANTCTAKYRAVKNAWAGVGLGTPSDVTAPLVSGFSTQIVAADGTSAVRVRARVVDQGDGLVRTEPHAQVFVNGSLAAFINLVVAPTVEDDWRYVGQTDIPLTQLQADYGNGPYNFTLRVQDWCGNAASGTAGSVEIDQAGPNVTRFDDVTSNTSWAFNPTANPPVNPEALSTKARVFFVQAADSGRIKTISLQSPPLSSHWTNGSLSVSGPYPVDFNVEGVAHNSAVTLRVLDNYNNATEQAKASFVDLAPPESCRASCRQLPGTKHILCSITAQDDTSGIWGVRVRTTGVSPEVRTLAPDFDAARRNSPLGLDLESNGWFWNFRDSPVPQGGSGLNHQPGQAFGLGFSSASKLRDSDLSFPPPLQNGTYTIQTECRDYWGNVQSATTSISISAPPVMSLTLQSSNNQGQFSFALSATDSDNGVARFNANIYRKPPGSAEYQAPEHRTYECGTSGNRPASCSTSMQATGVPGSQIYISAETLDDTSSSTNRQLNFVLPTPPPPPPPPQDTTTFLEVEDNDVKPGNLIGPAILTIRGKIQTNDVGQSCVRTRNEYLAACPASLLGGYCPRSPCGDHFTVDVPPNTAVAIGGDFDNWCFGLAWDPFIPNGTTNMPNLEGVEFGDALTIDNRPFNPVRNVSSQTKKMTISYVRRIGFNGVLNCPESPVDFNYTIMVRRLP